ncbi:integral membrane protein DUF92-domain-containing protein [Ganoderma leucocontextum]|nr:integral membrane protein DUF92-domain-containing protein [Ganoderma leucocontextum]
MQIPLPSIALSLVSLLAGHGLRKRSLSPSGAAAAFAVGYTMMSVRLSAFSVALIVFYLTGSRATKFGKALKQQLEEGHQAAGYRNAAQVFCNSLSAAIAALLWSTLYDPSSWVVKGLRAFDMDMGLNQHKLWSDIDQRCPLTPPRMTSWSRVLIFVTLGYVVFCVLAHTVPRTPL